MTIIKNNELHITYWNQHQIVYRHHNYYHLIFHHTKPKSLIIHQESNLPSTDTVTTNTIPTTPANELPQQHNFATETTENSTYLYEVKNEDDCNQQQQEYIVFYIQTGNITLSNMTVDYSDDETIDNKHKIQMDNNNNNQQNISLREKQKLSFHQKNNETIKLLPIFQSSEPYEIYFVNRNSSFILLSQLTEQIKQLKQLTLFARYDEYAQKYALVIVFFQQQGKLMILIIELLHLPYYATALYSKIKDLFRSMFVLVKTILIWEEIDSIIEVLSKYNLLWPGYIKSNSIVNLEKKFRTWYNPKI
ncbi:unnamed protein product [Adineta steineri]|uniref:Uncharacterized protein n=1 Tax=Adineta steineri TaxID=433720 RepID=A0A815FCM8_9BILA|nr:unnamed protein product [Adineta steineri]CAF4157528.1 unnamed protein product [Adineta steineri]